MSIIQAILLGVLQGIAEFLPISSSGHLAIAQSLFGLDEVPLLYDVFLHLATLAAVVLFFWKKIWKLLKIFGRWISRKPVDNGVSTTIEQSDDKNTFSNPNRQFVAAEEIDILTGNDFYGRKAIIGIIISTIITGALGVITSKVIPDMPCKVICGGFLVTSALLIISAQLEKRRMRGNEVPSANKEITDEKEIASSDREFEGANKISSSDREFGDAKPISVIQAIVVGFMQGFGTLPGISRSGSTIAGALFSGVDRKTAGEYSFIVSIPAVLGAFILEAKDLGEVSSNVGALPVIAGCVSAFVVGYFSLAFLMKLIRKGKLEWFAAYLIPAGILGMIFL